MRYAYFVTEGPHDVEAIGRLLGAEGLRRIQLLQRLDPYWHPLVPRGFPIDGDLLRRVPVPVFFANADVSVAVHSAGGITKLGSAAKAAFLALDDEPHGFGVVLDADDVEPAVRWREVVATLPEVDAGTGPGIVGTGRPRAGIFILPDNDRKGSLEDLLIDCGELAYPQLMASARNWVNGISPDDRSIFLDPADSTDFAKPTGRAKAIVGSVASILRPGKAIQVSIQDNRWLRDDTALRSPSVSALRAFLQAIIAP